MCSSFRFQDAQVLSLYSLECFVLCKMSPCIVKNFVLKTLLLFFEKKTFTIQNDEYFYVIQLLRSIHWFHDSHRAYDASSNNKWNNGMHSRSSSQASYLIVLKITSSHETGFFFLICIFSLTLCLTQHSTYSDTKG